MRIWVIQQTVYQPGGSPAVGWRYLRAIEPGQAHWTGRAAKALIYAHPAVAEEHARILRAMGETFVHVVPRRHHVTPSAAYRELERRNLA